MIKKRKNSGGVKMALIKCPECGKSVSDKASKCPDCGYPLCENDEIEEEIKESKFGVASLCIVCASIVFGWFNTNVISVLLAILSAIFGVVALKEENTKSTCGIISCVLIVFLIIVYGLGFIMNVF